MIQTLIAKKANVNIANKKGLTALYMAVIRKRSDIVTILLDARADVNAYGDHGDAPIHKAYAKRQVSIVQLLEEGV